MAAPSPIEPQHPQRTRENPGPAIQRGADEILALVEHEKAAAVHHREATINYLNSHIQALSRTLNETTTNMAAQASRHNLEKQRLEQELAQLKGFAGAGSSATGGSAEGQPAIDALQEKRDQLRLDLECNISATKTAAEQMGIFNSSPHCYTFAGQWGELFDELGIEAGKIWKPEQLLSVIVTTAERLRNYRSVAPLPHQPLLPGQYTDPFVLSAELARARAYVSRLEGEYTYLSSSVGPPIPPTN